MNRKAWGQSGLMKAAVVLALLGWVLVPASAALGKTLWNNGDWDQFIICPNNIMTNSDSQNRWQIGYDDFQVLAPGWVISGLWADMNITAGVVPATIEVLWTIRSGYAPGGPAGLESVGLVAWGEGQASATEFSPNLYRVQAGWLIPAHWPGDLLAQPHAFQQRSMESADLRRKCRRESARQQ